MNDLLFENPAGGEYLTAAEISQKVPGHPHPGTIGRWATHGLKGCFLPSIRIGGKRLYRKTDVLEFLATVNDEN